MILFVSGGELVIIVFFILIFFGADKIPEFAKVMGKGVREFKKATDDIKREINESTSGVLDDITSTNFDLNDLTKEITEPVQKLARETTETFNEYQEQFNVDFYYDNQDNIGSYGNEYQAELSSPVGAELASAPTELNQETQS